MPDPRSFALVVVETADIGRLRNIHSVAAAAQMLLFEWPEEGRGPAYRSALRTCLATLEGKATTATAWATFIAAAEEVRIFVEAG